MYYRFLADQSNLHITEIGMHNHQLNGFYRPLLRWHSRFPEMSLGPPNFAAKRSNLKLLLFRQQMLEFDQQAQKNLF